VEVALHAGVTTHRAVDTDRRCLSVGTIGTISNHPSQASIKSVGTSMLLLLLLREGATLKPSQQGGLPTCVQLYPMAWPSVSTASMDMKLPNAQHNPATACHTTTTVRHKAHITTLPFPRVRVRTNTSIVNERSRLHKSRTGWQFAPAHRSGVLPATTTASTTPRRRDQWSSQVGCLRNVETHPGQCHGAHVERGQLDCPDEEKDEERRKGDGKGSKTHHARIHTHMHECAHVASGRCDSKVGHRQADTPTNTPLSHSLTHSLTHTLTHTH
jgi:hypothetical protein